MMTRLDEYLFHADYLYQQVTMSEQWQALTRMTRFMYAHDAPTILTLIEKLDHPPFLVCSPMQAASYSLPQNTLSVPVIVPRIVRVKRTRDDLDMVSPQFVIDQDTAASDDLTFTSVGITDGEGEYRLITRLESSTDRIPVVVLSQGNQLTVSLSAKTRVRVSVTPVAMPTHNYEIQVESKTHALTVPVKTPLVGVVNPYKAMVQTLDITDGGVIPLQYATDGASIQDWVAIPTSFPVESFTAPTGEDTGIRLRTHAHDNPDPSVYRHYMLYLATRLRSLVNTHDWHTSATSDDMIVVSGKKCSLPRPSENTVVSLVTLLCTLIAHELTDNQETMLRLAHAASSMSACVLEIPTPRVDAYLMADPARRPASLDELDIARRIMISLLRLVDPSLLGSGHGTSLDYPFTPLQHPRVDTRFLDTNTYRLQISEGVITSINPLTL
ncbi:hypothetical protein EJ419_05510 [Alloscardovia theropitheci]|uniref:Uncharacterized protein n=1 Tax=Alloscardovia theropitheci TaxID=2496842 RepID=A0A4R0QPG5_9BIFI|nr:hypothetical protein [Alloscardovia theropitheci]TCD54112.1 hypothetical protein EJ419_05510 [Alloscardovia theropitheci]